MARDPDWRRALAAPARSPSRRASHNAGRCRLTTVDVSVLPRSPHPRPEPDPHPQPLSRGRSDAPSSSQRKFFVDSPVQRPCSTQNTSSGNGSPPTGTMRSFAHDAILIAARNHFSSEKKNRLLPRLIRTSWFTDCAGLELWYGRSIAISRAAENFAPMLGDQHFSGSKTFIEGFKAARVRVRLRKKGIRSYFCSARARRFATIPDRCPPRSSWSRSRCRAVEICEQCGCAKDSGGRDTCP